MGLTWRAVESHARRWERSRRGVEKLRQRASRGEERGKKTELKSKLRKKRKGGGGGELERKVNGECQKWCRERQREGWQSADIRGPAVPSHHSAFMENQFSPVWTMVSTAGRTSSSIASLHPLTLTDRVVIALLRYYHSHSDLHMGFLAALQCSFILTDDVITIFLEVILWTFWEGDTKCNSSLSILNITTKCHKLFKFKH